MSQQEELEGMPAEIERERVLTLTVHVPYFGKKDTGYKLSRRIARVLMVRIGKNVSVLMDGESVEPAEDGQ